MSYDYINSRGDYIDTQGQIVHKKTKVCRGCIEYDPYDEWCDTAQFPVSGQDKACGKFKRF